MADFEDIFYKLGLGHTKLNSETRRRRFHQPTTLTLVMLYILVQRGLSALIHDKSRLTSLLLSDIGRYFDMGVIWDGMICIFAFIPLSSKIFFYYNYKQGYEPVILNVFNKVRRFYATQNAVQRKRFTGYCRWLRRSDWMSKTTFFTAFVLTITGPIIHEDVITMLLFGVPNSLIFGFWGYILYSSTGIQTLYFFIICKYLSLKIGTLNESIKALEKRKRMPRIRSIVRSMLSVYRELKRYNSTYMSKFLLTIWLFNGEGVVFLIYILGFTPIRPEMQVILVYAAFTQCLFYLFIIFTASSVTHQTKKTYKILNSFNSTFARQCRLQRMMKLKTTIEVNNVIEYLGKKKVGFSCWVLFVITYLRCAQVIILMAALFLNLIEITEFKHKL